MKRSYVGMLLGVRGYRALSGYADAHTHPRRAAAIGLAPSLPDVPGCARRCDLLDAIPLSRTPLKSRQVSSLRHDHAGLTITPL